jgi:inner membrane protein
MTLMWTDFRNMKFSSKQWWLVMFYLFAATVSHGLLDALTDGGLGVAFFSPFDTSRYFFPWRPISVCPMALDSSASKASMSWQAK